MKQALEQYGDGELSLIVFNDEGLYLDRHSPMFIEDVLSELFSFTDRQRTELEDDLEIDLEQQEVDE